jgi:hypothetical protein
VLIIVWRTHVLVVWRIQDVFIRMLLSKMSHHTWLSHEILHPAHVRVLTAFRRLSDDRPEVDALRAVVSQGPVLLRAVSRPPD